MPARTTFGTRHAFGKRGVEIARPAPRPAAVEPAAAAPVSVEATKTWPIFTFELAGLLAAIYWLELHFSVDPMPQLAVSVRDSVAFGGVGPHFVFGEKEWWRIFVAPFLHGSLSHLIGNAVALIFAGIALERMLGRGWLAALFVVGAIGGSLGSLAYSTAVVSVGASGALMCLVTVLFALSHHVAAGDKAIKLRRRALFVVVSALMPSAAGTHIDYGAHFGGFAVGIVAGFLLLILWPEDSPRPPLRRVRTGIAIGGVVIALLSAFEVYAHFPIYAAKSAELIPTALESRDPVAVAKQSAEMVERYPHDPLAHLLRGTDLFDAHDYSGAEQHARAGLAEKENLDLGYTPIARERLEMLLAASLWGEGRHEEAKPMVARICASTSADEYLTNGRAMFQRAGACN